MDQIRLNLRAYKKFWTNHQPTNQDLACYLKDIDIDREQKQIIRFDALIQAGKEKIFERNYFTPGHVTASVLLVDPPFKRYLLTHHKKLEKWLQLGGHADGEKAPQATALQEAREESGVHQISLLPSSELMPEMPNPLPIDLDIHAIPPYKDDLAHEHFDFRYLAVCHKPEEIICSDESHEIAWFAFDQEDYPHLKEVSLRRLIEKAKRIKEHLLDLPAEFLRAKH